MRKAISRRRPLKRTSRRLATLLQAISRTKQTAARRVAKAGLRLPLMFSGKGISVVAQLVSSLDGFCSRYPFSRAGIAAFAWSSVTPGFSRPMTRRYPTPRIRRSRGVPADSNGLTVQTSRFGPNQASGRFGSTPTIVCGVSFRVMLRPRTFGSLPNLLRQKLSVIRATLAVISSSGRKRRPRIGRTPRTSK
jgi:hypothetical protein